MEESSEIINYKYEIPTRSQRMAPRNCRNKQFWLDLQCEDKFFWPAWCPAYEYGILLFWTNSSDSIYCWLSLIHKCKQGILTAERYKAFSPDLLCLDKASHLFYSVRVRDSRPIHGARIEHFNMNCIVRKRDSMLIYSVRIRDSYLIYSVSRRNYHLIYSVMWFLPGFDAHFIKQQIPGLLHCLKINA